MAAPPQEQFSSNQEVKPDLNVSFNRKARDLIDSVGGTSFHVSDLKPKFSSTLTDSGDKEVTCFNLELNALDKFDDALGSFPDSEPFEDEIFNNVRREERIWVQCEQDHSFKLNFNGFKTSIKCILDPTGISNIKKDYDTNHTQALLCMHCKVVVVAEIEPNFRPSPCVTFYDLNPYVENQKVKHGHHADQETVGEVLERVATERRLLEEWDPNDFVVYLDQNVAISLDGEKYCSLDNSLHHSIKGSNVVSSCQRSTTANQRVDETKDGSAGFIYKC